MTGLSPLACRSAALRLFAGALLLAGGTACGGEAVAPSSEAALPADSLAAAPVDTSAVPAPPDSLTTPTDSTAAPPVDSTGTPPADSIGMPSSGAALLDTRSRSPGIVFASDGMRTNLINSVHTGSKLGGAIGPSNVLSVLADARARGGRVIIKLCMGSDSYVKNSDGTFSFTKWKALVDRFRNINIGPYITDGTILAHFLIDEPHRTAKWGGKVIPHATLEAMAKYSKQIWPGMNTMVHTQMGWLANTSVSFINLDAGWAQYTANKGEVTSWITTEIEHAKRKGLGLMIGLNVLAGGTSSTGLKGYWGSSYAMNANDIRNYGTKLLSQSYACAFILWSYNSTYYGRSDIKTAMAEMSTKARNHVKTSCRQ